MTSSDSTAAPSTPPTDPAKSQPGSSPQVTFDFKSGGWILVLSFVLVVILVVWRIAIIKDAQDWRDGVVPGVSNTNGFDLGTAVVPVAQMGNRRLPDGMQVIIDPGTYDVEDLVGLNRKKWTKYLIPKDRVIGVSIGGEARAYPTRILSWHEVANDTLGGVPIAVVYCPFTGTAAVYDRRVGDEVLTFGMSGLVYNANILVYDRRGQRAAESLWSTANGKAVSGPAAQSERVLRPLPCQLVFWEDWLLDEPETTILAGDPRLGKQYRSDPYLTYAINGRVPYPVEPRLPEEERSRLMEPTIIVGAGGERREFSAAAVKKQLDPSGSWTTTLGGVPLVFYQRQGPRIDSVCTWVIPKNPQDRLDEVRFMYRFAWWALLRD